MENSGNIERAAKPAMIDGMLGQCPNCHSKTLFKSYLKPAHSCSECGEDFSYNRTDDGPAYITILIIAHIMGFLVHALFGYFAENTVILTLLMMAIAIVLALFMLPRVKGALIGLQWAKRMHGF